MAETRADTLTERAITLMAKLREPNSAGEPSKFVALGGHRPLVPKGLPV